MYSQFRIYRLQMPLQIAKLSEAEERMIAGIAEMTVVSRFTID